RALLACNNCRRLKIKCNGMVSNPCSQCLKRDIPCKFSNTLRLKCLQNNLLSSSSPSNSTPTSPSSSPSTSPPLTRKSSAFSAPSSSSSSSSSSSNSMVKIEGKDKSNTLGRYSTGMLDDIELHSAHDSVTMDEADLEQ